jgi:hypothetical protein
MIRPLRTTKGAAGVLAALAAALVTTVAGAAPLSATAPVDVTAGNPLAGCPPDGFGVNYPDAEVEPWVDVNPTDPDNIVAIYQQDRYDNGGAKGNVSSASFNGGLTWTAQRAVPADIVCTGGQFDRASDPWLSFGPDGTLHAMSLVTDAGPAGPTGDNGMVYNRSTDGGLSWEDPIVLIKDTRTRFLNDKNSMTADPNDADVVYAVWDRLQTSQGSVNNPENVRGLGFKGPIYFTRTTNGGDSWEPARKIFETGANKQTLGNQIVVLPTSRGGDVLDFFSEFVNASNRSGGFPVNLSFIRSTDQGEEWGRVERVAVQVPMSLIVGRNGDATIDVENVPCPDPTEQGSCPIRSGDLIPDVAVDPANGNLYAVWMDARFDGGLFLVDHDNIAFAMSTNGGRTWSPAIKVNRTPTTEPNFDQQAFTPSVDVADDGTVTVTYYDFRNNTASTASLDTDYFAVHCHSASENCANPASWNEETRLTPASFDIRKAPYARGYFLGDYMGLASAGDDFAAVFGQAFVQNDANQFFSRLSLP